MGKAQPKDTVSHYIFLPKELHERVTKVAKYGEADDLIIECVSEAMEKRWREWLRHEAKKLGYDLKK